MGTDETAIGANARNQWRARGVHCSFQSFLRDGELSLHARMKHAEEGDGAASLDHRLTTMGRREINIEAAVSRCSGMPEYVFVHPEDTISDADVHRGRTEFHLVYDDDMRFSPEDRRVGKEGGS